MPLGSIGAGGAAAAEFGSEFPADLIYLRWIEERSFEEIAEAFDCTAKQVRDRHRRIVLKLRSLIRDSIDEGRF